MKQSAYITFVDGSKTMISFDDLDRDEHVVCLDNYDDDGNRTEQLMIFNHQIRSILFERA